MITITVYADEVLLRLDQIPRRLRAALRAKFEAIFDEFRVQTFSKSPGRFLDPNYIKSGVTEQGSLVVGFIESDDKGGFYEILPVKARALRFFAKSGELVYTRHVRHPFLRGAPIVAREILLAKPWIEDQVREAVAEGIQK